MARPKYRQAKSSVNTRCFQGAAQHRIFREPVLPQCKDLSAGLYCPASWHRHSQRGSEPWFSQPGLKKQTSPLNLSVQKHGAKHSCSGAQACWTRQSNNIQGLENSERIWSTPCPSHRRVLMTSAPVSPLSTPRLVHKTRFQTQTSIHNWAAVFPKHLSLA